MEKLKGMNQAQSEWWHSHNHNMVAILSLWSHDRTRAYTFFTESFRKNIDLACERLGIKLATAWDEDGWDGEEDADIITTSRKLQAIKMKMAGFEIPAFWFVDEYER